MNSRNNYQRVLMYVSLGFVIGILVIVICLFISTLVFFSTFSERAVYEARATSIAATTTSQAAPLNTP